MTPAMYWTRDPNTRCMRPLNLTVKCRVPSCRGVAAAPSPIAAAPSPTEAAAQRVSRSFPRAVARDCLMPCAESEGAAAARPFGWRVPSASIGSNYAAPAAAAPPPSPIYVDVPAFVGFTFQNLTI